MTKVPRRLDAEWLQAAHLTDLLAVLDRAGEEARVVGGAVRNALLDEPVSEWDIATTASPETVMMRARQQGWAVAEVPVQWRHVEASRVSAGSDAARMLYDLLRLRLAHDDGEALAPAVEPTAVS